MSRPLIRRFYLTWSEGDPSPRMIEDNRRGDWCSWDEVRQVRRVDAWVSILLAAAMLIVWLLW